MRRLTTQRHNIVTCRDTDGHLWTFRVHGQYGTTVEREKVFYAGDLIKMDNKETVKLYGLLKAKSNAFWAQALEDYEDEKDKLTLVKSTLKFQSLQTCFATLGMKDVIRMGHKPATMKMEK